MRTTYRTDWWSDRDRPSDADPTEEDDDHSDAQLERRRRLRSEFFRVFDIACGCQSSDTDFRTQSSRTDHGLMHDPYSRLQNTIEYCQDPGKPSIVALRPEYDQYLLDHDVKLGRYQDLDEQEKAVYDQFKKEITGTSYQDALLHFLKDAKDREKEAEERAAEAARLASERVRRLNEA